MNKKLPERTCIVCRKQFDKNNLVRIVKSKSGEIFLDLTGKADGRGAYICNNPECFKKLKKTKALNRAFKQVVDDSVYLVIEENFIDSEK